MAKKQSMKVPVDTPPDTSFAAHSEGYGYGPARLARDELLVEKRVQFAKALVAAGRTIKQAARETVALFPLPPGFGHAGPGESTTSYGSRLRELVARGSLSLEEAQDAERRAVERSWRRVVSMPPSMERARDRVMQAAAGASASAAPSAKAEVESGLTNATRRTVGNEYDAYAWPGCKLKVPSVVIRLDGRYGVARPMRVGEEPRSVSMSGGRPVADSSCTTGLFHEKTTYATRAEAERRAWALARELGRTGDWP